MAITVVRSAQSAGGANATSLAITTPTAGNTLVTFFSQSAATTPTASGYTVNATKAVMNASADSTWVGYKIADGTETSVAWTIGSGGTAHGVCYWEIAGAAAAITLDGSPAKTDNLNAATGGVAVTTSVAGSIILIGVGHDASSGTISAWTGTNVATNISTSAARCYGGSFITGSTVSSTFTANWATSHVASMLAIALQPASGTDATVTSVAASAPASAPVPVPLTALSPAASSAPASAPVASVTFGGSVTAVAASAPASAPVAATKVLLSPDASGAAASIPTVVVAAITSATITAVAASAPASVPVPGVGQATTVIVPSAACAATVRFPDQAGSVLRLDPTAEVALSLTAAVEDSLTLTPAEH